MVLAEIILVPYRLGTRDILQVVNTSYATMSRKQRVLEQVQRNRRRRGIIATTIVGILIVVLVVGVYALVINSPHPKVSLPSYLDKCVVLELPGYHSHPNLTIIISGYNYPIPAGLGIQGSCLKPLHVHEEPGVIHIEPDENRTFTLSDFFLTWGNWANNPTFATFNSTQIFSYKAGPGTNHLLSMTVNGSPDTTFQNHQFPHKAASTSTLCVYSPCVPDNIVITYA